MANERRILESVGCVVEAFTAHNDDVRSIAEKVEAAIGVVWNVRAYWRARRHIRDFQPDIVHVHNFFPLISPSIFDACRAEGVPVVMTLHNFRLVCASPSFFRNGKICEKCINGNPYWGAVHRCYRQSAIGSLSVATMIAAHRQVDTWGQKVNYFIAMTRSGRRKFIEAGLPEHKIIVKPNFVEDPRPFNLPFDSNRYGALYVGRLSREKGIDTLLNAWQSIDYPLRLAGSGPLTNIVSGTLNERIKFIGHLGREGIIKEMNKAAFLIAPSICYETFNLTIAEAYSCGLPVIASNLGAIGELVVEGVTGSLFNPGDSNDLRRLINNWTRNSSVLKTLSVNARMEFEAKFTAAKNLDTLIAVYARAIKGE